MNFSRRFKLAWAILTEGKRVANSNMLDFAREELVRKFPDEDSSVGFDMNRAMRESTENLMLVFALEGHSGFSTSWGISVFERLARFKPLSPLTGDDDEWNQVAEDMWQNRRCYNVFKDSSGGAYVSDHYVFQEPTGAQFTGFGSQKRISFPYTPEDPVIVKVDEDGNPTAIRYKDLRKPREVKP